ncbi:1-aminocyclopropane-1-carboxylate deaminase [Calidithermus terrae]|uniref:1-aminocyclopropane-1-carboxylate deaminase n=1 Tax=Calidithermus terrae TaxID=1408545 RepID=A0A399EDB8_9DEIN|nr:1-aminocyclopropane-1-carboxylate deaminase [Calidithermus terrae]
MRKLEYLVADALAQGCDTLVSIGGVQSNHTRQVAAVAAHVGLKALLVQEHWVNYEDPIYDRVGNILLSRILGAEIELSPAGFSIGLRESWQRALDKVRQRGGKPYAIPAGASDHPLGGIGYARFAQEVAQQERELGVFFDHVVVCSVTGSTQAGMVVGFAAQGRPRRVVGVDASAKPAETRAAVHRIARSTAQALELGRDITDEDVILLEDYAGPEYGLPSEGTLEAIRLAAQLEGMITDVVYEGKSMHALIDLARKGMFEKGSRVLYVHLGGAPAMNAYAALYPPRG